jgi:hypothetical protein
MWTGVAIWSKWIYLDSLKSVVVWWLLIEPSFNIRNDYIDKLLPKKTIPVSG